MPHGRNPAPWRRARRRPTWALPARLRRRHHPSMHPALAVRLPVACMPHGVGAPALVLCPLAAPPLLCGVPSPDSRSMSCMMPLGIAASGPPGRPRIRPAPDLGTRRARPAARLWWAFPCGPARGGREDGLPLRSVEPGPQFLDMPHGYAHGFGHGAAIGTLSLLDHHALCVGIVFFMTRICRPPTRRRRERPARLVLRSSGRLGDIVPIMPGRHFYHWGPFSPFSHRFSGERLAGLQARPAPQRCVYRQ